jgi:putative methionine-R-sulfoxide reductase with GAF domain
MSTRALEAIDRVLNRSGDADEALRDVVRVLADEPAVAWAGIAFLEAGGLTLGPAAGEPDEDRRVRVPISFRGSPVGELWVDGEANGAFLERVAVLISHHVLVGWDTRGETWEP